MDLKYRPWGIAPIWKDRFLSTLLISSGHRIIVHPETLNINFSQLSLNYYNRLDMPFVKVT